MKNIITRAISGTVYVLLITCSILIGRYGYLAVFSLITGLALWEFYQLIEKNTDAKINKPLCTIGGLFLFITGFLYFSGLFPVKYTALWFLVMIIVLIRELFIKGENAIRDISLSIFGHVYIAIPLMFLGLLGFEENPDLTYTYTPLYLLSFFVIIWVYDTGAFLFGITFGKHRLFERISPKKSWEGAIGGAFLAVLTSIGIFFLFPGKLSMPEWIGFALVTIFFATWGDLVESMIKRSLNVKDSGNILPGHGGILDRIDSCLLAAPATVIYFVFIT